MNQEKILPTMNGPAIYRIRVQGVLESKWAQRLEAMNITETTNPEGGPESILVGRLEDQSALAGVFNSLHDMRLPVLLIECLKEG